jgi:hypothetical protein
MSATKQWPTAAEVAELAEKLGVAYNAVDEFSIRTHMLIDPEEPYERPDGVPVPSLEQVGIVATLVTELEYRVEGLKPWLRDFRQLRDSASTFSLAGGAS